VLGFLKHHPTLRHIAARSGWYFLTFLLAVTLNFFLPRLGNANPVDLLMARASEILDAATAREQEEAYLSEFGLVVTDEAGELVRDAEGKPIATSLLSQFVRYVALTLRGDLGTSILQYPRRVGDIIATALPWTLALQLPTIIFGWIVGNVLGALAVGLLLGVIETGVARLLDPGLTLAATYGLFMLALLIRPQGLFGSLVR
jgi:peptide/nickel transport system permease protein